MNETTGSDTPDVYGALWIGALLLASGAIQDPFPAELEEVVTRYFRAVPVDHEGVASAPRRRPSGPLAIDVDGSARIEDVASAGRGAVLATMPVLAGTWRESGRSSPGEPCSAQLS